MYRPTTSAQWQAVPASLLAALLVLVLFAVLPLVNHIDARRTRSSGEPSTVAVAPARPVTIAAGQPRAPAAAPSGIVPTTTLAGGQSSTAAINTIAVHVPQLEPLDAGSKKLRSFVVDEADLDAPPLPFHRTRPEYPFQLRRDGIPGTVVVDFRVDPEGRVFDVRVVEASHPEFAESVVRAVQHWRFVPGTVRGETVSFKMRLPVRFKIESAEGEAPTDAARDIEE